VSAREAERSEQPRCVPRHPADRELAACAVLPVGIEGLAAAGPDVVEGDHIELLRE